MYLWRHEPREAHAWTASAAWTGKATGIRGIVQISSRAHFISDQAFAYIAFQILR